MTVQRYLMFFVDQVCVFFFLVLRVWCGGMHIAAFLLVRVGAGLRARACARVSFF